MVPTLHLVRLAAAAVPVPFLAAAPTAVVTIVVLALVVSMLLVTVRRRDAD